MLFSSAVVVVALSASLANAFPSSGPINAGLEARTNCPYNNFLYPKKSCCVKNGGDTPGTPETGHSCPQNYYWHKTYGFCVPKNSWDDKGSNPTCTTKGHNWNDKKSCCSLPEYSCDSDEFWWKDRSCCVKNGGPQPPRSPPSGSKCPPNNWSWDYGQGCCVPHYPNLPSQPDCDQGWEWKLDIKCCRPKPTPSSPTHPSQTPCSNKDKYGNCKDKQGDDNDDQGDDNNKYGHKRGLSNTEKTAKRHKVLASRSNKPVVLDFCPYGYQQCAVAGVLGESECLDTLSELTSCGGCTSVGAGVDCTKIPHVKSASCLGGSCRVFSCDHGYERSGDERSCVRSKAI